MKKLAVVVLGVIAVALAAMLLIGLVVGDETETNTHSGGGDVSSAPPAG